MKSAKPIYTMGHRNPDTDSICSAIGYAHLKQAIVCESPIPDGKTIVTKWLDDILKGGE